MIDLKQSDKEFEAIKQKLLKKQFDPRKIEELKALYLKRKNTLNLFEQTRFEQNAKSRLFGTYKKEGKDTTALQEEVNMLKARLKTLSAQLETLEQQLHNAVSYVPNLPDETVPEGVDGSQNVEIKKILVPPVFDFEPKAHWDLAAQNGWIDFARGVKIAKSRFSLKAQMGAQLERALINYMLDFNTKRGFVEYSTPFLASTKALFGAGQLPKFEEDLFKTSDGLYLIPTSEVTLTNIFSNEILTANALPLQLTTCTPCFRKEVGSGGRDVRGIIREHQFYKVEMVAITEPQKSDEMLEKMTQCASDLLSSLNLSHRIVELCGGDLGFNAAKTYDIEVWLPSHKAYKEISSISNTHDFQARRAKIRYKKDKKNHLVHTLNGSALAVGRCMAAIMENFQDEKGNIAMPEVLKSYLQR